MTKLCAQYPSKPPPALLVRLLAWVTVLVAWTLPGQAAEPATAIIVFDGSGSMWGKLDGERQSKFVMGRDAVRQGLARLAPDSRVGLMSFGHRRAGDCQDTEVILKPEPVDVERVLGPLEKLNPRGRGPLTKALREAARDLGPQSAPASVVLIHDGPDNCQQDPCTAVGELRQAHPGVRVHVVSLGLSPEDAKTVSCLPLATGGKHFTVASAEETNAALIEAMRLTGPAAPGVAAPAAAQGRPGGPAPAGSAASAPAPQFTVPAGRPGLQLSARLVKGGPAVAVPVNWQVRRAGEKGAPLWEGTASAPLLVLPTGKYTVEARSGLVMRQATVEAAEGQPRALDMVLDAGTLVLATSGPALAMLKDAVVSLARLEATGPGTPSLLRQVHGELALPAGNYLFSLTAGNLRIERPIGIEAGARVSIDGSISVGAVELAAAAVKDGPPLDGVTYAVYEDDPDAPQGRREVARSAAGAPRLLLPAGIYLVIARRGSAEARDRVTVRTGETERRVLMLDASQVALSVRIAGGQLDGEGPIAHRLERLEPQPREVLNASGAQATFDVASGRYRLETRMGLGNVRIEREIRLKPGETERVALEHAAGAVRLRLLDPQLATPAADVAWEIRDRGGQMVWTGLATEARALLLAGRYVVRAEGRNLKAEQAIEVRPGEARNFDLAPR